MFCRYEVMLLIQDKKSGKYLHVDGKRYTRDLDDARKFTAYSDAVLHKLSTERIVEVKGQD